MIRHFSKLFKTISYCLVSILMCTGISSCTSYDHVDSISIAPYALSDSGYKYIIQPGDTIEVKFFYSQDLNDNVLVRPDGNISLQLVDDVYAAGLTVGELDKKLTKLYSNKLPDGADVSVIMRGFSDERVYISGEVSNPGEYDLKHKLTALQAITSAGGFTDDSKRDAVLLIRQREENIPDVFLIKMKDIDITTLGKGNTYTYLYPRDIVYVPKSNVAKVDLFMDQYVRDVLMFNGVSAGVTGIVELNDADD